LHELSLAQDVLTIIEQSALKENFKHVREITISIGKLAGVEIDSFVFALEHVAESGVLQGSKINITQPEAHATCNKCRSNFVVNTRWDNCPTCLRHDTQITSGEQLQIIDLIVSDQDKLSL